MPNPMCSSHHFILNSATAVTSFSTFGKHLHKMDSFYAYWAQLLLISILNYDGSNPLQVNLVILQNHYTFPIPTSDCIDFINVDFIIDYLHNMVDFMHIFRKQLNVKY